MHGSNFVQLVSGGGGAVGVQLDSDSDQFYWASNGYDRIVSSQRYEIGVVESIVQVGTGESPWGLTTFNGSIYWGNSGSGTLQRSSPTGEYRSFLNRFSTDSFLLTVNLYKYPTPFS